jgi:trehalose 6-phosphate synthase
VVVSNRLPPRHAAGRKQNVGGLVSGLRPALASREGLWLGWDAGRADDEAPPGGLEVDDAASPARGALHLPAEIAERHYTGFCNGVLWPFLHGMLDKVQYDDDAWAAYIEANERFADAVTRVAAPGATVWVHDYHLMLLGAALRRRGFSGKLGFFLHVPFPAAEIVETLPRCEVLLEGLARYDLVGFHTARYARNFLDAARELTDARAAGETLDARGALLIDEHRCDVGVFPIGIDPSVYAPSEGQAPDDEVESLRRSLRGRKLVLGVDRLDYTKGICERLVGFERLLREEPAWRGKVSLVQIAVPSREDVPQYQEQRARVESLVGRINGEHGETDWVPVRYLYRSYAPAELARLYRMASVGLVTPLRDGMNLVAKEFVAAQDPADPGVLVLSRFAGAAAELGRGALLTNPLHADGLARDVDRALRMEHMERRVRHAICLDSVVSNTAEVWCASFLRALEER